MNETNITATLRETVVALAAEIISLRSALEGQRQIVEECREQLVRMEREQSEPEELRRRLFDAESDLALADYEHRAAMRQERERIAELEATIAQQAGHLGVLRQDEARSRAQMNEAMARLERMEAAQQ